MFGGKEIFHSIETFTEGTTFKTVQLVLNSDPFSEFRRTMSLFRLNLLIRNILSVLACSFVAKKKSPYSDTNNPVIFCFRFVYGRYIAAHEAAGDVTEGFQSLIVGRRSIGKFDKTPVDDNVVYRAIQCAISAPNRSCTEPWRFICVGPQTVSKFAELNARLTNNADTTAEEGKLAIEYVDWTNAAPGWCVVTTKTCLNTDDDGRNSGAKSDINLPSTVDPEDYKSVCCAIQNFMLSIWSEGIGTKWTAGPVQKTKEFADLCGIDLNEERVAGIIWYGYAAGGTRYADPRRRQLTVDDVLTKLP